MAAELFDDFACFLALVGKRFGKLRECGQLVC